METGGEWVSTPLSPDSDCGYWIGPIGGERYTGSIAHLIGVELGGSSVTGQLRSSTTTKHNGEYEQETILDISSPAA